MYFPERNSAINASVIYLIKKRLSIMSCFTFFCIGELHMQLMAFKPLIFYEQILFPSLHL